MNKVYNILIIESDMITGIFIKFFLLKLKQNVIGLVKTVNDAGKILEHHSVDFIFINLRLADSVNRLAIKTLENKTGIIYVGEENDTIRIDHAMNPNIYGYLLKPLSQKMVENVLHVASDKLVFNNVFVLHSKENCILLGNHYSYNVQSKTLLKKNKPILLTEKEREVLYYMVLNLNESLSYKGLKEFVWNHKKVTLSTIRDTVLRLRKKAPLLGIENLSGIGYCLRNIYNY